MQAKEAAEAAAKLVRADLHCEQQYNANLQAKACQVTVPFCIAFDVVVSIETHAHIP